jgi:hypothetical protein
MVRRLLPRAHVAAGLHSGHGLRLRVDHAGGQANQRSELQLARLLRHGLPRLLGREDFWSIDPHLGTADDLVALSAALHARSMCLVLDVVANHVRPLHAASNVSVVKPFDSLAHYHTFDRAQGESFDAYCRHPASCLVGEFAPGCRLGELTCKGYDATQVEKGWFASLGDLNHEHPYVSASLVRWVRQMVANYSVDAIRLDTAAYMPKAFLSAFQRAAQVDILGEVTAANLSFHASYQTDGSGPVLRTHPPLGRTAVTRARARFGWSYLRSHPTSHPTSPSLPSSHPEQMGCSTSRWHGRCLLPSAACPRRCRTFRASTCAPSAPC